jgi:hypothetical protein
MWRDSRADARYAAGLCLVSHVVIISENFFWIEMSLVTVKNAGGNWWVTRDAGVNV